MNALDPHTWPAAATTLVLEGLAEYQTRGQILADLGVMAIDAQLERIAAVSSASAKVTDPAADLLDPHEAYTVRMAIDAVLLTYLDDPGFQVRPQEEQRAFFADLADIAAQLEPVMVRF